MEIQTRHINYGRYIVKADESMRIVYADKGFSKITGYTNEEALREHSYISLIPPEDREVQMKFLMEILTSMNAEGYLEHRILKKDGSCGFVFCFGHPYVGSDYPGCFEIIIADTTDTKYRHNMMKNEIAYRKKAFDTLVSSVPGGMIQIEVNEERKMFEIVSANDEFFDITGWDRDLYMSSDSNKYAGISILPEYHDVITEKYKSIKETPGEQESMEFRFVKFDGDIVWARCRVKYFDDNKETGNPIYFCIIVDITKEKYTEYDLSLTNKLYQKTIDYHNNDYVFRYNIPTQNIYLTSIKTGVSNLFYDIYEFERYIYPEHYPEFLKMLNRLTHYVEEIEIEIKTTFCSEEYHWCKITANSISNLEGIYQIDGTISDINKYYDEKAEDSRMFDEVTGFYKATIVQDMAKEHFADEAVAKKSTLMFFGLKYFEGLDDYLGSIYTDIILKKIANSVKEVLPDNCFIGRMSTYVTMVVFNTNSAAEILDYSNKISAAVRNTYIGTKTSHKILSSIGIAVGGTDGSDYDTLFKKAASALAVSADANNIEKIVFYDDNMGIIEDGITRVFQNKARSQRDKSEYDVEFVNFVFALLSSTKDIDGAINIILEQIGERYNMQHVVVYERVGNVMHMTNQWLIEKGIVNDIQEEDITTMESYIKKFNKYGLRNVRDIELLKVDEFEKEIYRRRNIKSITALAFFDTEKNINGSFTMCSKEIRDWDDYALKTFTEISKILAVFVKLRSERERDTALITKLSTTDSLTGIYNMETFKKLSAKKVRYSFDGTSEYAMAYIDLNDFSFINENFGYSVGDRVLMNLAKELEKAKYSVYACRRYSDYFIVLFSAPTRDEIIKEIENCCAQIVKWQKGYYSTSELRLNVGLYFIKDARCGMDVAIENANIARKFAKEDNTVVWMIYKEEMRQVRDNEILISGELQEAIENDMLELYLQPKFDLETRVIVGAEALVRWRNGDGSLRFPDTFIPALEKNGYIVKLDFHMYDKLMEAMERWKNEGRKMLPISVNFSRVHTRYSDFVDRVCAIAEKHNVDKDYVEIEITEGALSGTNKMMEDVMNLKKNGFKVDIDDFGTGYSSLNLLLEPLFDVVKVDKSIINSISSEQDRIYVKKLVELIRNSDKKIVFEGVETEEQIELLVSCGCHTGQGYLFSKPIPLAEFEEKYL